VGWLRWRSRGLDRGGGDVGRGFETLSTSSMACNLHISISIDRQLSVVKPFRSATSHQHMAYSISKRDALLERG